MTKKLFLTLILSILLCKTYAQNQWAAKPGKILTSWANDLNPNAPLPEYPRPQLVRDNNWKNLNGLWEYAIVPKNATDPKIYDGKILVPFAVESALSGVQKTVGKDSILWYKSSVVLPSNMRGKQILLHFGAVDWQTEVFVNGKSVGKHQGGFDPFSFNITSFLKPGNTQDIKLSVWDPTDDGPQPRGKQVKKPGGIWYTPVTGIWQTVWLEALPDNYIVSTKQTPDIDSHSIKVSAQLNKSTPNDQLKVEVLDGKNVIASEILGNDGTVTLKLNNEKLWSPTNPFLYDLRVSLIRKNKTIDQVMSYFAMRKISMGADKNGIQRMLLNNKFLFQYGPLDQGWWPDGLYTPATERIRVKNSFLVIVSNFGFRISI